MKRRGPHCGACGWWRETVYPRGLCACPALSVKLRNDWPFWRGRNATDGARCVEFQRPGEVRR